MKRAAFFLGILGLGAVLCAQELPEYYVAAGLWELTGDRLVQEDPRSPLAKTNIRLLQEGDMIYEFNVRYEGGAEDGHGGFGLHIFADSAFSGASWGSGRSFLLWLNYDLSPISSRIPAGLSAQVYRSFSNSRMDLVESVDLNQYAYLLTTENLAEKVPFKILVNAGTGEFRVYDPTDNSGRTYYHFTVENSATPLKGNWLALRTNGMEVSFGMGL